MVDRAAVEDRFARMEEELAVLELARACRARGMSIDDAEGFVLAHSEEFLRMRLGGRLVHKRGESRPLYALSATTSRSRPRRRGTTANCPATCRAASGTV
jgi:hypothetical protein